MVSVDDCSSSTPDKSSECSEIVSRAETGSGRIDTPGDLSVIVSRAETGSGRTGDLSVIVSRPDKRTDPVSVAVDTGLLYRTKWFRGSTFLLFEVYVFF